MGEETQGLRREISDTRTELSRDVDALTEKVSPSRVVDRRMQRAKDRVTSMRDRVMGSASDVGERTRSGVSATGETVRSKTEGSPLAAGLLAFGAGLLVSALIPPSKRRHSSPVRRWTPRRSTVGRSPTRQPASARKWARTSKIGPRRRPSRCGRLLPKPRIGSRRRAGPRRRRSPRKPSKAPADHTTRRPVHRFR